MTDLTTLVARSIGRTINEKNHMVRAEDVFRTIEDAGYMIIRPDPHIACPNYPNCAEMGCGKGDEIPGHRE